MKNACEKWKDPLREAALTGTTAKELEEHLRSCAKCAAELEEVRARAERLDTLLPLVAQGAEHSADFRARVLAAAAKEAKRARPWRVWTLAAATAASVVLMIGAAMYWRAAHWGVAQTIQDTKVAAVQKLAEWRAPSDSLLVTPGQEILRTMPKLGESYLSVPAKTDEEE